MHMGHIAARCCKQLVRLETFLVDPAVVVKTQMFFEVVGTSFRLAEVHPPSIELYSWYSTMITVQCIPGIFVSTTWSKSTGFV